MLQINAIPLHYTVWQYDLRNVVMTFRAKSELSCTRQLLTRVVQFYFQPEQLLFQNLLVFVRRVSVDILMCLKFSTFCRLVCYSLKDTAVLNPWICINNIFAYCRAFENRVKIIISSVYVFYIYFNYCLVAGVKILGILLEQYFFS